MNHFSLVLAVVDFSGRAYGAFEHALALSARNDAELVALHVVPPDEPFDARSGERLALAAELRRLASQAGVHFTAAVAQGDAAAVIPAEADSRRADLIVMAGHPPTRLHRFTAPSVEERVAAGAAVPVLLVPGRRHAAAIAPFGNIAAAVDFKAGPQRVIQAAGGAASGSPYRLTLLHVVPRVASDIAPDAARVGIVAFQDLLLRDDQEQLVENASLRLHFAARRHAQGAAAVSTRVLLGDAAAEIGRVVADIGADLLVAGAQRCGRVWRLLFGSATARLLEVGIPLLLVPDARTAAAHHRAPLKAAA